MTIGPTPVVDPGFHTGANSKGAHDKLIFGQFSPENCMKIKGNQEIGPRGGRVSDAPLDAPRHSPVKFHYH